ncbi:DUF2853 family protein [Ichthyenterobacterium sp. W332]|uniref:DUF2853 family protein n=1 Tax=Microcosmobacter mediterraneus TaxID=3075607 RepID=A0ABU2YMN2_9FLAO|nr:DUF2853 family protein [Ichthyenterobacterium sp. W332]MDT0559418.1 DUF2853 family protein [Ichthyenterobacterium sp. W332]
MSKRDELIAKYAADLKDKCGVNPDMDLLTKVTIGCGPSIYNRDASTVSASDDKECETVKQNFIKNKLGVSDAGKADAALNNAMDTYGRSTKNKYRAVVYYLITKDLNKESIYN